MARPGTSRVCRANDPGRDDQCAYDIPKLTDHWANHGILGRIIAQIDYGLKFTDPGRQRQVLAAAHVEIAKRLGLTVPALTDVLARYRAQVASN